MPRRRPMDVIAPAESDKPEIDAAANREIAIYNHTGNMLALWAVLGICARAGVALPEGVDKKFAELSELLLEFAQGRVIASLWPMRCLAPAKSLAAGPLSRSTP